MTHTGQCLCGAVKYTGHGEQRAPHVCHCGDCAKWVGGPFIGVSFSEGITIHDGPIRWFKSSDWAERGSCATCGSAMFWRMYDGSFITVTAGSLNDPSTVAGIEEHIFIDHKPTHYDFADKAPRLTAEETLEKFAASL